MSPRKATGLHLLASASLLAQALRQPHGKACKTPPGPLPTPSPPALPCFLHTCFQEGHFCPDLHRTVWMAPAKAADPFQGSNVLAWRQLNRWGKVPLANSPPPSPLHTSPFSSLRFPALNCSGFCSFFQKVTEGKKSIHWCVSQMVAVARAGSCRSQELGSPPIWASHMGAGPKHLNCVLLPFQVR